MPRRPFKDIPFDQSELMPGTVRDYLRWTPQLQGGTYSTAQTTSSGTIDMVTISGMNIQPSEYVLIRFSFKRASDAGIIAWGIGLKINATVVNSPSNTSAGLFIANGNGAASQSGHMSIVLTPARSQAGWSSDLVGYYWGHAISGGTGNGAGNSTINLIGASGSPLLGKSAQIPTAAITDVTVQYYAASGTIAAEVRDLVVYSSEVPFATI